MTKSTLGKQIAGFKAEHICSVCKGTKIQPIDPREDPTDPGITHCFCLSCGGTGLIVPPGSRRPEVPAGIPKDDVVDGDQEEDAAEAARAARISVDNS